MQLSNMKFIFLLILITQMVDQGADCRRSSMLSDELHKLEEVAKKITELNELKSRVDLHKKRESKENQNIQMLEYGKALTEQQMKMSLRELTEVANTPSHRLDLFRKSNPMVRAVGKAAQTQLNVIKAYKEEWDKKRQAGTSTSDFWKDLNEQFDGRILKVNTRQTSVAPISIPAGIDVCPFVTPTCGDTTKKHRTFDGTCNNEVHPEWGSTNRAQGRLINADYSGDLKQDPRKGLDGNDLRSARNISLAIFPTNDDVNAIHSYMTMQFGQFLDHDLTHTPVATAVDANNQPISVDCGTDNCNTGGECFPIPIISPDTYQTSCMKFVRSANFLPDSCTLTNPSRNQANTITAFVDASQVYGSSQQEADELVDFNTGLMKTSNPTDPVKKQLMPFIDNALSGCSGVTNTIHCFKAGDVRTNEQVGLTAIHTIFMRMHNHIHQKLKEADSNQNADTLFKKTRRILGAMMQHIVYKEYLPIILGKNVMDTFKLTPLNNDYFTGYSKTVKPNIMVAFSTAAFRFGHTEILSLMQFVSANYQTRVTKPLHEVQFNPSTLYESMADGTSGIDKIMMGVISSNVGQWDRHFADEIQNHLFETTTHQGFDLPALNIQRGRDHGVPGYAKWREFCKLSVPTSFTDLQDIPQNSRTTLSNLYGTVQDIDLFVGAMLERRVNGGVVGPTFACIIATQFQRLKEGDRFYYENNDSETKFELDQLKEIRKIRLSSILCDTMDNVVSIQRNVMRLPTSGPTPTAPPPTDSNRNNDRVPCSQIPRLDYRKFVSQPKQGR